MREYEVSEDSDKFPLDNTTNNGDMQDAVLNMNKDGAADVDLEGVNVAEREKALRMRMIMSGVIDECAASLRTTLVRHISLRIPS